MSSVVAKVNKSQVSKRHPVAKTKRVSSPKPKAKRIAIATKAKKVTVASKPKKEAATASRKARIQPKKAAPRKKSALKPAPAKARVKVSAKASPRKPVASRKSAGRKPVLKARQEQPKPVLSPGRIAAVKAFEQALKQFNQHEFDSAKTTLTDVLERFGDQPDIAAPARTYLAICDHRLARAPQAPRNPDALYDQGVFEFNRGRTREAIDILEKALKAEPRADHVLYSLAIAYARHGDISKAIDALRRSISIRPVQRSHARHDPDFASLRTNREFQRLTGFGFEPPE